MSARILRDWRDDAACLAETKKNPLMNGAWDRPYEDEDASPFAEAAKKICRGCPVRDSCLQSALDDPEADGTYAEYEFDMGRLPVAVAREIRDTTDLTLGEHQSVGRAKT